MKRIKHNDLLPWFTQDHGTLPASYLRSCELLRVRPLLIIKNDSGRITCPSLFRYKKLYLLSLITGPPIWFLVCNPAASTSVYHPGQMF